MALIAAVIASNGSFLKQRRIAGFIRPLPNPFVRRSASCPHGHDSAAGCERCKLPTMPEEATAAA